MDSANPEPDKLNFLESPQPAAHRQHAAYNIEREEARERINIRTILWIIFGAVLIGFMVWYVAT
jgi:hypothetical protein